MDIHVVRDHISRAELQDIANERFGDMVKAVVDLKHGVIALGSEMHADAESILVEAGSLLEDLWGINLYPAETGEKFIEFDSMINIRPALGNRTRGVDDADTREKIRALVGKIITD